jgi:hypothetical protein
MIHHRVILSFALFALAATPARASLFTLAASGTISENSSGDSSLAVGTPWSFDLTYNTAAPDLDFELEGSPDPTFGLFTNAGATPALTSFHYRAGSYEVALDGPADFAAGSEIVITFTGVHAIDIIIFAPGRFPPLGGGAVSFHADFNDLSSRPIFTSDGLPTNTALGPDSFDLNSVNLLPPAGAIGGGELTSLTVTPVAEPSAAALAIVGLLASSQCAAALRRSARS